MKYSSKKINAFRPAIIFFLSLTTSLFWSSVIRAQSIGINTTGSLPNASAILDVDASPANDKGLLIPRVALTITTSNLPIGVTTHTPKFKSN